MSQQNRDLWWIWLRRCLRSCLPQPHQTREDFVWMSRSWKICCKWRSIGENLRDRHHQVIQKRIMVNLGLFKRGKVELRSTTDQGNLRQLLGKRCNKLPLIVKNIFSTEMRIPQSTERRFTMDRGNLRQWITKKRQIPKNSSWTVTQRNLWIKSKTKCNVDRRECRTLQS